MLHSQWAYYIHYGHVTFQMGTLHSKWARYIPNGHVTFQMGTLHSKWARYIPNGHVTFTMGMLHSQWACYIPLTFTMGTLHSQWARYFHNGHVTFTMGMFYGEVSWEPGWDLSGPNTNARSHLASRWRSDLIPNRWALSPSLSLIASILFSSSCIASYLRHGCTTGATVGWMALWYHPLLLYATITHAVYTEITHVQHPSV